MENYKGFYKINEHGGSYITALFYNPETNECFSTCVADFDNDLVGASDLYYIPIDNDVAHMYERACGKIGIGDKVIITKGRKMLGETKVVMKTFRYNVKNTYNKVYIDYLVFEDGTKVSVDNCQRADGPIHPIFIQFSDIK